MKVIILGSGTSTGVPEVGCNCTVCTSDDIRDKRLRSSALVVTDSGKHILIDCGPDFRAQALSIGLGRVDAILITHEHYDHVYGLDDMRTISWKHNVPIYAQPNVLESIKKRMHYVFSDNPYPGTPKFELCPILEISNPFTLFDVNITPIEIKHGLLNILGYRFDNSFCYITDMKRIEEKEHSKLLNLPLIIINALRYKKVHPSHQSIIDVYNLVDRLNLTNTNILLTHLSHNAPVTKYLNEILPDNIRAAYDTMTINIIDNKVEYNNDKLKRDIPFKTINYHRIPYKEAWEIQHKFFNDIIEAKRNGIKVENKLLICEHNPVFTLGLHGKQGNMLMSKTFLQDNGYEYFEVERGGDITYHGPGQITGYPIFDLESFSIGVKKYIDLLEECIIDLIDIYGIKGERDTKATGVWIDPQDPRKARKICAIGVKCSRYVTMHGFALNVNNSLEPFTLINPCGFVKGRVTSIRKEVGEEVDYIVVVNQLTDIIYKKFSYLLH